MTVFRKRAKLPMLRLGPPVLDIRTARPGPKIADPFYTSREWRALLATIIRERGRRCEDPACERPDNPGQIYGDHIREIRDGVALLDKTNVMFRCARGHGRKTAAVRADRMRI